MGRTREIFAATALFAGALMAVAANPPAGHDANDDVTVSGVYVDAAAAKLATGVDSTSYTVIDVTVTPKPGKTIVVDPDDFLLRLGSTTDHSGPLSALQILGAGGGLVLKQGEQHVIGIDRTNPGYTGIAVAPGNPTAASSPAIAALKAKLLPAVSTTAAVHGLLFFPIEKKKPKDMDLVYSAEQGKLHISFR